MVRRAIRPGKKTLLLLFLLDLENFGVTRIDAHIDAKELRAVFDLDREESLRFIRQELPGFREILIALGYRDVLLAAKPLRELSQEKREKFAALAVGAPSSMHLLDMKADMDPSTNKQKQAVVLRYEPKKDRAPNITGKGRGYLAEKILDLARQHDIPIRQDKNLLQILSRLDLHQEVPAEVYKAVAEILAFIYRLSNRKLSR